MTFGTVYYCQSFENIILYARTQETVVENEHVHLTCIMNIG